MPLLGTIKRKSQPDPEFKIVWEVPTLSSQEQMQRKHSKYIIKTTEGKKCLQTIFLIPQKNDITFFILFKSQKRTVNR